MNGVELEGLTRKRNQEGRGTHWEEWGKKKEYACSQLGQGDLKKRWKTANSASHKKKQAGCEQKAGEKGYLTGTKGEKVLTG